MNKIALEIIGLSYSESQTGAYVLILGDKNSRQRLPIVIGGNEAQSIAMGVEKQKNARPLTHDLFISLASTFNIKIREVVINRFREGVFFALLVCEQNGEICMIDSRPSDAIALAVRFGCDIFAYESVMEEAGIVMDDEEALFEDNDASHEEMEDIYGDDPRPLSLAELEEQLQRAIEEEDYITAASIRDEINRRK